MVTNAQMFRCCAVIMAAAHLKAACRWSGVLYPLGAFFDGLYIAGALVGLPLIVFRLDKRTDARDVRGGYGLLLGWVGWGCVTFAYFLASLDNPGVINAMLLTGFEAMILVIVKPVAKKRFGENWIFVAPLVLLAGEAGQGALLLKLPLTSLDFFATLILQLGMSYFKKTGVQLALVEKIKKQLDGDYAADAQAYKQMLASKHRDLSVIAAGENFAEILIVVLLICLLLAQTIARAAGLSPSGPHAHVASDVYLESSILKGWAYEIEPSETAILLVVVLAARVGSTIFEESRSAHKFPLRRQQVKEYLELLLRDGPHNYRVMFFALVLAIMFAVPTELAWAGRDLWMLQKNATDDM